MTNEGSLSGSEVRSAACTVYAAVNLGLQVDSQDVPSLTWADVLKLCSHAYAGSIMLKWSLFCFYRGKNINNFLSFF